MQSYLLARFVIALAEDNLFKRIILHGSIGEKDRTRMPVKNTGSQKRRIHADISR